MEENKTFHLYASFNEYKDYSLLRDRENIIGSNNDYLLNNKLDKSNEKLCVGDDNNETKHPILDKIQVVLDVVGVLGFWGAIPDAINSIIYLCRGDLDSMKFSLIAIFTPIPASVAKTTANAAKYANKVTTKGGYVFWSGGKEARKAAENFAKENGFTTLEMTRAGEHMDTRIRKSSMKKARENGYSWLEIHTAKQNDTLYKLLTEEQNSVNLKQFERISKRYAEIAAKSGKEIHYFRTPVWGKESLDNRLKSIWIRIEKPTIKEAGGIPIRHIVK